MNTHFQLLQHPELVRWDPSILEPSLWLDATNSDSLTLTATTVNQMDDLSGNNNHLITGSASYVASGGSNNLPYINNTSMTTEVIVDGDVTYGNVGNMLVGTIVEVQYYASGITDGWLLRRSNIVSDVERFSSIFYTTLYEPNIFKITRWANCNNLQGNAHSVPTTAKWLITTYTWNRPTSADGTASWIHTWDTGNQLNNYNLTVTLPSATCGVIIDGPGWFRPSPRFSECLVFDRVLSSNELNKLTSYLNNKYQIYE